MAQTTSAASTQTHREKTAEPSTTNGQPLQLSKICARSYPNSACAITGTRPSQPDRLAPVNPYRSGCWARICAFFVVHRAPSWLSPTSVRTGGAFV